MQERTVELETFLEGLPAEDAAKAKAAAARIDELEHAAQRIGQSDKRYVMMFGAAGVLGLMAAVLALGGYEMFRGGQAALGEFAILAMTAAFPAVVLVYCVRMRERTKIDQQQFRIIETYFLPHDAIYLPRGPERETGLVTISPRAEAWRLPDDENLRKPGRYW